MDPDFDTWISVYEYGDENDPCMERTTLCVTTCGHFYLAGHGGKLTRWRRRIDGIFDDDEGIELLSIPQALSWIRRHDPRAEVILVDRINRWIIKSSIPIHEI